MDEEVPVQEEEEDVPAVIEEESSAPDDDTEGSSALEDDASLPNSARGDEPSVSSIETFMTMMTM